MSVSLLFFCLCFGDVTSRIFTYPDCESNVLSKGCSFSDMVWPGDPMPEGLCKGTARFSFSDSDENYYLMFCFQGIRYFVIKGMENEVGLLLTEDPKFKTPEGYSMKTRASTFKKTYAMVETGLCCCEYKVFLPSGWAALFEEKEGEIRLLGFEKKRR